MVCWQQHSMAWGSCINSFLPELGYSCQQKATFASDQTYCTDCLRALLIVSTSSFLIIESGSSRGFDFVSPIPPATTLQYSSFVHAIATSRAVTKCYSILRGPKINYGPPGLISHFVAICTLAIRFTKSPRGGKPLTSASVSTVGTRPSSIQVAFEYKYAL
jgi:hypothetical protein